MAAQDAPDGEGAAPQGAVGLDRLDAVGRARRREPARRRTIAAQLLPAAEHGAQRGGGYAQTLDPRVRLHATPWATRARSSWWDRVAAAAAALTRYVPGGGDSSARMARRRRRRRLRSTAQPTRLPVAEAAPGAAAPPTPGRGPG